MSEAKSKLKNKGVCVCVCVCVFGLRENHKNIKRLEMTFIRRSLQA